MSHSIVLATFEVLYVALFLMLQLMIIYKIIRLNHTIRGKSRDAYQANCVSRDTCQANCVSRDACQANCVVKMVGEADSAEGADGADDRRSRRSAC